MSDVKTKRATLLGELGAQIKGALIKGRRNYYAAYLLRLVGLLASVGAGALGLFVAEISPKIVGLIALLPGATALLGSQLKLQSRANFFYKLAYALDGIRSRATYSELESDNPGALAYKAAELRKRMDDEWARSMTLDFSPGGTGHSLPSST